MHKYFPARVIPLASKQRILPNTPTPITAIANEAIDIGRLAISGAHQADWVVNDLLINGQSQLAQKDLPGYLFGTRRIGVPPRSFTSFRFDGFDVLEQGQELRIIVTYAGTNPEGGNFLGSVSGTTPHERPSVLALPASGLIKANKSVKISVRLQTAAFRPELLEIAGDASRWVVNDYRVNGRSMFAQAGDVPGDMFATNAIDGFLALDTCLTGNAIDLIATYIGDSPDGEALVARIEGTIAALDATKPPELRARVTASGEADDAGVEIVATTSPRPRSRSMHERLEIVQDTSPRTVADLIDQCSELVATRAFGAMNVEVRLVNAPDPTLGRKLAFFAATADGKRAEISAHAVDVMLARFGA